MTPFRELLLSSAFLPLAIALPAPAATNYQNQGFSPGIDGFNPSEKTISAGNVQNLTLAWSSNTTDINGVYAMVENNGTIFVNSEDQNGKPDVVALNGSTGAELWKALTGYIPSPGAGNGIAAAAGLVFAACESGTQFEGLCAYSQKTGKTVWSDNFIVQGTADCCNSFERPTYAGGVVYVAENLCDLHVPNCNDLWAINAKNGATIWSAQPSAFEYDYAVTNWSAAVSNGSMYVPCGYVFGGNADDVFSGLCTFSASSGTAGWSVGLVNDAGGFATAVSVSGTTAFFQYGDQNRQEDVLEALSASTGSTLWSFTSVFGFHDSVQPTVAKGAVYWPDANGTLWSLKERTGATNWSFANWPNSCSPVGGANGTESQPQIVNGVVFITTSCSTLGENSVTTFALSAGNGALLWSGQAGTSTASGAEPMIVSGTLYNDCVEVCAYNLGGARAHDGHLP